MPKFKYLYGGTEANWEEHLYHKSLNVVDGIVETDDELDIDALLRRGWEPVEEDGEKPAPKAVEETTQPKKASKATSTE